MACGDRHPDRDVVCDWPDDGPHPFHTATIWSGIEREDLVWANQEVQDLMARGRRMPAPERDRQLVDLVREIPPEHRATALDAAAAASGRDDGRGRAGANADPRWKANALSAVHHVAATQPELVVDDVWRFLAERPTEGRAMGAVMQQAARSGWIEATDRYAATVQAQSHAGGRRVWRSLIFRG